jgi:hypothetical protein
MFDLGLKCDGHLLINNVRKQLYQKKLCQKKPCHNAQH